MTGSPRVSYPRAGDHRSRASSSKEGSPRVVVVVEMEEEKEEEEEEEASRLKVNDATQWGKLYAHTLCVRK